MRQLGEEKKAGLHDVAKLAGVSHTTVSRVLNGHPYVSLKTRSLVESAILELDFRPNIHARSLVTRVSRTIGILVISDASLTGSLELLSQVSVEATNANLFTSITNFDRDGQEELSDAVNRLLDQAVIGLVVISSRPEGLGDIASMAGKLPLVFCKAGPPNFPHRIRLANQKAGYRVTRYLLELGHTHIAHLGGPAGLLDADDRKIGWERAMDEVALDTSMFEAGGWSADSGYERSIRLIESGRKFTAVFAGSDEIALGLIHALNQRGLEVPRDVSIVGFDDLEQAKHFRPALTTIRQDFSEFGSRVITMLQAQIDGSEIPEFEPLNPQLVIRNSCREV
jgi:DNA-binding LacI/PurR family transcriptional regulator